MNLLEFMNLFTDLRAASWDGWRAQLARITDRVREVYGIVGRGAGKSRILAALAAVFKATRRYALAPGEKYFVGIAAPDRKQSTVTFGYIRGFLHAVPALKALIVRETRETIELSNGVIIEVFTASGAAPRGRAYVCFIIEEAAFLPTGDSANPDLELVRAVRPALARVPGSLLVVVSSPYARRGVLFTAFEKYHGQPDGDVVLIQATTAQLNPTFDEQAIARAYEEDPSSASAEYGAEFRSDVEALFMAGAIDQCITAGRLELPPQANIVYRGFVDFAGGSGSDSATLAIGHTEGDRQIVDCVREARPPFSPSEVCRTFAETCARYGVTRLLSDRWGGEFSVEGMRMHGVHVEPSAKAKSDLYRDLLPLLNSGQIELLDVPRLKAQLAGLERRVARGGRDSIDHGPGGHDDVANAVAGVLTMGLVQRPAPSFAIPGLSPVEAETPKATRARIDDEADRLREQVIAGGGVFSETRGAADDSFLVGVGDEWALFRR